MTKILCNLNYVKVNNNTILPIEGQNMSKKDSWRQNMITCLYSVILLSSREIYSNHNTVLQISHLLHRQHQSDRPVGEVDILMQFIFLYFGLMRLIWDCL